MRVLAASAVAGPLLVLAFPPFGWAFLAVPAVALFLWGVRAAPGGGRALTVGGLFGVVFFGLLFPWIGELGLIALVPLLVSQALFPTVYARFLWGVRGLPDGLWLLAAVGGWGLMELLRVRIPLGGFGWGLLGYPAGEYAATRGAAQLIGASGWGVVLAAAAAGLVLAWERRRPVWLLVLAPVAVLAGIGIVVPPSAEGAEVRVAVVQGSSPCPGEHCPNEREQIYRTHLELTRGLEAGAYDLVVWPEGSTGGSRADPVRNPEVGEAIAAEAARIGAAFLVGGDRPLDETSWVNVNVVWDRRGERIGEYPKRHPVPFGEYVPGRSFLDWIPALSQVPRDMVPGDAPVVFDLDFGRVGSVISFESSFARYPRDTIRRGAELLVVATSQASYPYSTASDQLIGMTRMRAAELGVDVVHASVSGRSTLITDGGEIGERTPLAQPAVVAGTVQLREQGLTPYARWGDWLQWGAVIALGGVLAAVRVARRPELQKVS